MGTALRNIATCDFDDTIQASVSNRRLDRLSVSLLYGRIFVASVNVTCFAAIGPCFLAMPTECVMPPTAAVIALVTHWLACALESTTNVTIADRGRGPTGMLVKEVGNIRNIWNAHAENLPYV